MPGQPACEKASNIGSDKRKPPCDQPALQLNPLAHEVNWEPIGNEKKDWVGEHLRNDRSPGLRSFQKVAPPQLKPFCLGRSRCSLVGCDHLTLARAAPMVRGGRLI